MRQDASQVQQQSSSCSRCPNTGRSAGPGLEGAAPGGKHARQRAEQRQQGWQQALHTGRSEGSGLEGAASVCILVAAAGSRAAAAAGVHTLEGVRGQLLRAPHHDRSWRHQGAEQQVAGGTSRYYLLVAQGAEQ